MGKSTIKLPYNSAELKVDPWPKPAIFVSPYLLLYSQLCGFRHVS